jgi:hypothetical protein
VNAKSSLQKSIFNADKLDKYRNILPRAKEISDAKGAMKVFGQMAADAYATTLQTEGMKKEVC